MANPAYLASTLVMGLLIFGVLALVLRARRWHHYAPQAAYGLDAGGGRPQSGLSRVAGATSTWTLAYVLLVVGFLAGVIVTMSGVVSGPAMIAGLLVAIVVYLIGGIYIGLRGNGRPSSQAAAGSAITLGMLFVIGITVKLILGL